MSRPRARGHPRGVADRDDLGSGKYGRNRPGAVETKIDRREETQGTFLVLSPPAGAEARADLDRLRRMLGLHPSESRFRIVSTSLDRNRDEIGLVGRSVLGVMLRLSQAGEAPPEHEAEGRVTVAKDPSGKRFDWSLMTGPVFRIRLSSSDPTGAFVKASYRGARFCLDGLNSRPPSAS